VVFASPVIFLQIWRFISPGLYHHEKRVLIPFALISTLCFLAGAAFGYWVVFSPVFQFLLGYASDVLEPMPAVDEYFSLALRLFFAFGLIFELPVALVFLARIGVVNKQFLTRNRKYAVLIAFVVGAILTPPDVVSQVLMAVPLILLYEVSILAVGFFARTTLPGFSSGSTKEQAEEGNGDQKQKE
jgi:Twin arginine targeting (Tat) protein translocase TatC